MKYYNYIDYSRNSNVQYLTSCWFCYSFKIVLYLDLDFSIRVYHLIGMKKWKFNLACFRIRNLAYFKIEAKFNGIYLLFEKYKKTKLDLAYFQI